MKKRSMDELRQTKDSVYTKPKEKRRVHERKPTRVGPPYLSSEEKRKFGTTSSHAARNDEKGSEWIPNPDLNRPPRDRAHIEYEDMSKRELELLGRTYGMELDRRLRKSTLVQLITIAAKADRKRKEKEAELHQSERNGLISVGLVIGVVITLGLLWFTGVIG